MTITQQLGSQRTDPTHGRPAGGRTLLTAGGIATLVAAGATTAVAASARAAGAALDVGGESIPLAAFAQLTVVGALVGLALAALLARRSSRPRVTFVKVTGILLVLSLVPDVLVDTDPTSKAVLALTHLVAAAVVIPALATRLRGTRA